ncbi:MAG: Ig-like domain-containing protein [Cytophagaceae bacterium]|jgi:hypothetical protein|nr:Ig-like domain-containing protein [Cytophagaceae bacterium]
MFTTFRIIIYVCLGLSLGLWAQKPYTAGEIQSRNNTQYGRYDFRMYSSRHSGTTSTFFLWKQGSTEANVRWNEIDIETFGKDAASWQSNPIWEYNDGDQNTKRWEATHGGTAIALTWVNFGLEWTPNYIAWFVNGTEVRRVNKGDNVPANHFRYNNGDSRDPVTHIADPMRIAFNHWSAYSVGWLGEFFPNTLPSYQFVDWITYRPWNGTGFGAVSIRHDFNSMAEVNENYFVSNHTFDDNRCDFSGRAVGVTNGYLWLGIFQAGQERAPAGAELPRDNNLAPSVQLSSPANNTAYTAPASISMSATATDADGTISRVEFYNGATLLGSDATAPYTFTWTNVATGTYALSARAIDNAGASTRSAEATVRVNASAHIIPKKIEAEAYSAMNGIVLETSTDAGGTQNLGYLDVGDWTDYLIQVPSAGTYRMECRVASALTTGRFSWNIGTQVLAQFTVPNTGGWQTYTTLGANITLPAGTHTLRMQVSGGGYNINFFTINATVSNTAPTVTLTSPLGGSSYTTPASILLSAAASDADGSIARVEFYQGTTLLGSDVSAPYSITWNQNVAGEYAIRARAIDNLGASTNSSISTIRVNPANELCQTLALGATDWALRNTWSDAQTGSTLGSINSALTVTHRQWGQDYFWLISTQRYALQGGLTYQLKYTISGNYNIASTEVGLASAYQWDGPTLSQTSTVAAAGYPLNQATEKTIQIRPAASGSYHIAIRVNLQGQPPYPAVFSLSGVQYCVGTVLRNAQGILENESNAMVVFPNPSTDMLQLECDGAYQLEIVNAQGLKVVETTMENHWQSEIKNWSAGMYQIRLCNEAGCKTKTFVKQ